MRDRCADLICIDYSDRSKRAIAHRKWLYEEVSTKERHWIWDVLPLMIYPGLLMWCCVHFLGKGAIVMYIMSFIPFVIIMSIVLLGNVSEWLSCRKRRKAFKKKALETTDVYCSYEFDISQSEGKHWIGNLLPRVIEVLLYLGVVAYFFTLKSVLMAMLLILPPLIVVSALIFLTQYNIESDGGRNAR